MTRETHQTMLDPQRDLVTDYALIATGVAAALIALAFLILV
ncbi:MULTISPECIES: hypothetical protein [Bradyrhizobium]|jgi:hypothetical protein|uniref:Group 1 outer membrane protein n=1 Tax=Bradyrhizobium septentrionale TaxID=1404411 RepID=A0ABZ2NQ92_9BRAD|nr:MULTISPECIES: hypothetical protein [Bradyrhizobium]